MDANAYFAGKLRERRKVNKKMRIGSGLRRTLTITGKGKLQLRKLSLLEM